MLDLYQHLVVGGAGHLGVAQLNGLGRGQISGAVFHRRSLSLIHIFLPNCVVQITYHISLFVQQEGLSLALAATLTSLVMVGNTLGKLLLGMLNDRKGPWLSLIHI